ncbi:MAG: GntR family transcriptional regulator [Chitinophagaceae bacterium]|jgi:DNA-binding transcriptional regulator YhcF (GntR family)|nr:MAG: GntR family transcriptional regulator [Chitinophagaceae bacterium]
MDKNIPVNFPANVPKYISVADSILAAIRDGEFRKGEQLPSINEFSEAYLLSRDTVEKAYKELRHQGIIEPVKGKGYFISRVDVDASLRILLVFNKISNYKKQIFNAFIQTLGFSATVDLQIHHSNVELFGTLIASGLGKYDYYVIMPHFYENQQEVLHILNQIPAEKLIFLDKNLPDYKNKFAAVYQDFEKDIYDALDEALQSLKHYKHLVYVNPNMTPYPDEIRKGFWRFCKMNDFEFSILDGIETDTKIHPGDAFIVIEENDLTTLVKICKTKELKPGKDIGIISYNETPLKEVLMDGITVISTDHEKMGETVAKIIMEKRSEQIKNPFSLIRRKSL